MTADRFSNSRRPWYETSSQVTRATSMNMGSCLEIQVLMIFIASHGCHPLVYQSVITCTFVDEENQLTLITCKSFHCCKLESNDIKFEPLAYDDDTCFGTP